MKYKLIIIGFGTVSQGFLQILIEKQKWLKSIYGIEIEIVGVAAKKNGSIANKNGLDFDELKRLVQQKKSLNEYVEGVPGLTPLKMINSFDADILIEATPTNLRTGEPAAGYCKAALEKGLHVVTTNKGPATLFYSELKKIADSKNLFFSIEGTVMSGTPVLNTLNLNLAGCTIKGFRGILNGTTNYILTEMESGKNYVEVLKQAQQLGYAETDPASDVEGWDAAAKVAILTKVLFDKEFNLKNVECSGIKHITSENIRKAKENSCRYKLIGEAIYNKVNVKASVRLEKLPLTDPLAQISGTTNAITFETDLLGAVTIIGTGAGSKQTGFALLVDILAIHRKMS